MLLKENALKTIKTKSGKVFIFKCLDINCDSNIRVRSSYLSKASGFCIKHTHQKRPFEHIYNSIGKDGRKNSTNNLTYEEFLTFTKIKKCYYCLANIPWKEYAYEDGEYTSKCYFLDRKINSQPYSLTNCVVCCTHCNRMKSNLDLKEFISKCNLISSIFMSNIFVNFK